MSSKYQLYYSPGACSMAVHVVLHEVDQPFDLIKVDLKAPRDPAFLKISPRGQVPTLVEDGIAIVEGAAILIHLCEKFKSPLLPAEGITRAKALEALMFCNSSLHPACSQVFASMRIEDPKTKETAFNAHFTKLQGLWDLVEQRLEKTKYMAGDAVTVGDILLTVIANWAYGDKRPTLGKNTKKLIAEISQRPAYQLALEHENVEYKAAA